MIHIADTNLPIGLDPEVLAQIEVVERLTAEPISYYYEYAHPNFSKGMTFSGSYCWADELEDVEKSLFMDAEDMIGDPLFIPLFRLPASLILPGRGKPEQDNNKEEN
jgi:hypothetical protein